MISENIEFIDSLVDKRLKNIKKTWVFASGKGGVGKSTIASFSAYIISKDHRVGVLDLDIHGPSIPKIFGIKNLEIVEERDGIVPLKIENIELMSLEIFLRGKPAELNGKYKEKLIKEMISITKFENIEYLIVDLPPGTGDEFIFSLKTFRDPFLFLITTPNEISWNVVKRTGDILKNYKKRFGVLENMHGYFGSLDVESKCKENSFSYIGFLDFDKSIIDKTPFECKNSTFYNELRNIIYENLTNF